MNKQLLGQANLVVDRYRHGDSASIDRCLIFIIITELLPELIEFYTKNQCGYNRQCPQCGSILVSEASRLGDQVEYRCDACGEYFIADV